jgi:molecular chaperone GrpE
MADEHSHRPAGAPAATDPPGEGEANDAGEAGDTPAAEQLAALTRQRDDYYDRLLRKTAEFDNYRKRVERERREQADQAVTDLLLDLLLVVDDFERALAAPSAESDEAYRRGVELIYGKLQDLLRRRGVTPIEALGADFDPNLHQAVVHEESPGHREGEVMSEMRRGYKIGDRLLRPAMVKVAKA